MRRLRRKDWIRTAVLLTLVVALLVVELRCGRVRMFYVDHPLQAGIVTGVVLSLVAYLGFDAVRASMNDARWGPLSSIAFLSLAYQTTLVIDVLLWLVTGIVPSNDATPPADRQFELKMLRASAGVPLPAGVDLGTVEADPYRAALRKLLGSDDWCAFAVGELDQSKWRNRDGIARWAAAMLTTGEAAAVLNRLAYLNESLSVLQSSLRRLADTEASPHRAALEAGALTVWSSVHAEAVSLREDLWRATRGPSPTWSEFRRALAPAYEAEIRKRAERSTGEAHVRKMLVTPLSPRPPRRSERA